MSENPLRIRYSVDLQAAWQTGGTALLVIAMFVFALAATESANANPITYTYDVTTQIGGHGSALANDSAWTGSSVEDWVAQSAFGVTYLRNTDDADVSGGDIIIRPNDADFAYSAPADTTLLTFEFDARVNGNWMEVGLASGSNTLFRIGTDFDGSDAYHVWNYDGAGGELRTTAGTIVADGAYNLRLEINTTANGGDGSAVLYVNDANTVTVDNMHLLDAAAPSLTSLDSLWVLSASRFVGPGNMTITTDNVVPEPSTWVLMILGLAGMIALGRRHRQA